MGGRRPLEEVIVADGVFDLAAFEKQCKRKDWTWHDWFQAKGMTYGEETANEAG
jgi:hypothetical protein